MSLQPFDNEAHTPDTPLAPTMRGVMPNVIADNTVSPLDTLVLNTLIIEPTLWQVHNCKITTLDVTQNHPMPFLYHYDTLSDELKSVHPLTPDLLKKFNTKMNAVEASQLLGLPKDAIKPPWQVKIVGTLVIYSEKLQLAVRLRFTNTAKSHEAIYTQNKDDAIALAIQQWHFFGDVFVLNKQSKPVLIALDMAVQDVMPENNIKSDTKNNTDDSQVDNTTLANAPLTNSHTVNLANLATVAETEAVANTHQITPVYQIPKSSDYQHTPNPYAVALLTELEENKANLTQLDEAIQARLI